MSVAAGGTGKTFLIRLILTAIQSQNNIALDLASSEIFETLLPGGRTAHSALKFPLNMQIIETCRSKHSKRRSLHFQNIRHGEKCCRNSKLLKGMNAQWCIKKPLKLLIDSWKISVITSYH